MLKRSAILLNSIIFFSCATITTPEKIKPSFYPIDSKRGAMVNDATLESISCESKRAEDYICLSYNDLWKVYKQYVIGCQSFRGSEEIERIIQIIRDTKGFVEKF